MSDSKLVRIRSLPRGCRRRCAGVCPVCRFMGSGGIRAPRLGLAKYGPLGGFPAGDEKEQDKALALYCASANHNCPQCGQFAKTGAALFCVSNCPCGALIWKSPLFAYSHRKPTGAFMRNGGIMEPKEDKQKHSVWLTQSTWNGVREHYLTDGCRTQNEFVERAIQFYCGYLNSKKTGDYLPGTVAATLEGVLLQFGDRMGRLMFKQAVDLAMVGRLIAADADIDKVTLERLRDRCVQDVKQTNGQISFRDIMRFHDTELR